MMRPEAKGFAGLRVGDVVACDAPAPIHGDGPARWYALIVRPMREIAAEDWLRRRGVLESFHPVTVRRVVRRGRVVDHVQRYLPRMVFAKFPGPAVCHRVTAGPFITGALAMRSGEWAVLDPCDLRVLKSMAHVDARQAEALAADRERARRAALVKAGDRALFRVGALAGQPCEVVSLDASGVARVRLGLFGGDQVAEARADDLVPVRRVG